VNPFKFLDEFVIPKTSPWAILRWRFCDPSLRRFHSVLVCDRQTDIPIVAGTGLAAMLTPCNNNYDKVLMEQYANNKRVNIYHINYEAQQELLSNSELVWKTVLFCPCQITMYPVQCCLSWYLVYCLRAKRRSAISLSSVANCFSLSSAVLQREFPCVTKCQISSIFTLLIQFLRLSEKRRDICLQAFTLVL